MGDILWQIFVWLGLAVAFTIVGAVVLGGLAVVSYEIASAVNKIKHYFIRRNE